MSVFTSDDGSEIQECIECKVVLKHISDIESFCPECGHTYNSDLDTIKYKTKFTTSIELQDSVEPMLVNMSEYGKVEDKPKLPEDKELKKYGTTILTDEVTTYD